MLNIQKHPLMDEDWGTMAGGGGFLPKKGVNRDVEMGLQMYEIVQKLFIDINGGFCEQTDDSDLTNDDPYQVLEFLSSNYVFTTKKESQWSDSLLGLSIRYDNELKVIEDISFNVSFFNNKINDESMDFNRCYSINISIEDFVSKKSDILKEKYKDFSQLVHKFQTSML